MIQSNTMTDTTATGVTTDMIIIDECPATIPAGYFIKPDPALTRVETRHYLMGELARYLKVLAAAEGPAGGPTSGPTSGPVSRMAHLYRLLQADGKLPEGSVSEQLAHVGKWIFSVIQTSVTIGLPASGVTEYETLALAFWNVDLLPCGKTIGSFWDYSPFEALRTAPPLTEVEDTPAPAPDAVEDYSDMPGLITLEELARQTFAPADADAAVADAAVADAAVAADADAADADAAVAAVAAVAEEDYSDMPPLIPIDADDTIQQVPNADGDAEEVEDYVAYNRMPLLPQSAVDRIGGAVEAMFDFALRPVTIPVWGIALALDAIPPLFMTKC